MKGVQAFTGAKRWGVILTGSKSTCLACIWCLCLLLAGCKGGDATNKQVFFYNEATGIATLDPAFAKNQSIMWATHQLYNTLVEVDSNGSIAPSLALRWDISPDRLLYTFHLRQDVFFHDNEVFAGGRGRRMTAQDVVYSLQRITDKTTASSGAWIFNNRIAEQGFTAVDDSTFCLRLLQPFHPILGILSMQYCSVIPREVVDHYGRDFRRHPCGTGPFRFKFWVEGQSLVLEKNPQYWEKDSIGKQLPYLDAVHVSFYDNRATEFLQFRQGRLSFINDIEPSFKDEVLTKTGTLRPQWKDKILLHKHAYLATEYFGILTDEENPLLKGSPLRSKAIRQAINYAIDRRKLMMYLRNSIGLPAEAGMVPGGLPSQNEQLVKGYPYNPAKARELLKQAGLGNAATWPVTKLLTIPVYADMASFVARELDEVGINVQVEVVQKSLLLELTSHSNALFFRGSWIADYPDAENFMTLFYSKNPAPPNYTRYKNPAFDRLYEAALRETNDSLRYILYRQMDQLVIDDAPVVPLFYDMVIHLVNPDVHNMQPNALNLLELRRVYIQNPS
ncbi:peptide/nickel transport system substrate-binding protein [Filimonas zeae]|uniref:ABC transporter substrate-binding protein n=1 Tax=Filimonas zeae TaxID=1737353 RepID=UPI0016681C07|nr:ABC transporter substrate-binding protein [Filimonas zeae]MDR6338556.1 peptide/nickel transport system substrate-binding protein [Filimonas zeae]